jgi:hypothetical protein
MTANPKEERKRADSKAKAQKAAGREWKALATAAGRVLPLPTGGNPLQTEVAGPPRRFP